MLSQSCLHTASETFVRRKKNWIRFNCLRFASVTSILIGKDDEKKKKTEQRIRKFQSLCAMVFTRNLVGAKLCRTVALQDQSLRKGKRDHQPSSCRVTIL